MLLNKKDFDYELPNELIAQEPLAQRDDSRLLVFDKYTGQTNTKLHFKDLPQILAEKSAISKEEYVLVRNNSKVIPARIMGHKITGGQVEILLIHKIDKDKELLSTEKQNTATETWECLTKPGLKINQEVIFDYPHLKGVCTKVKDYTREITFIYKTDDDQNMTQKVPKKGQFMDFLGHPTPKYNFNDHLQKIGITPLPPYINSQQSEDQLRVSYQTTFAKDIGSVAAPTAGLHFTPNIERELLAQGVEIIDITLHVGLGTFLTVKDDLIKDHQMHAEYYEITPTAALKLNQAKKAGKKIIALGTTAARALESAAKQSDSDQGAQIIPADISSQTEIFIYPPYKFKFVDALITNYHLPESTLLMLISALTSAPNTAHEFNSFSTSPIGQAYQQAITEKFRFFSFGDAMIIL